jgi:ADP-ribose pyrophosphatase YjhB (NUDIX family)
MNKITSINLRVYALIFNEKREILLSDEYVLDRYMTKFPGGGLVPGEGIEDCILREAKEEFGQEIEIVDHYYTTGFFQKALFYEDHQLISVYYLARFKSKPVFRISDVPYDFEGRVNGSQSFRFVSLDELKEEMLSFPIDRFVLRKMQHDKNFSAKGNGQNQ